MRVYPIFTDGKKFFHSSQHNIPDKVRTACFSKYNLKDWKKFEEKDLSEKDAERMFKKWEKYSVVDFE